MGDLKKAYTPLPLNSEEAAIKGYYTLRNYLNNKKSHIQRAGETITEVLQSLFSL